MPGPHGRRLAGAALFVLFGFAASPGTARPLTLDDLQRLEGFSRSLAPPQGPMLFETLASQASATRFDDEALNLAQRTRLWRVETARGAARVTPILAGQGVVVLGASPSGRRLALGRVEGERLHLGILDLPSRRIAWMRVWVRPPRNGPSLLWRDERRLLVLAPRSDAGSAFSSNAADLTAHILQTRRQAHGAPASPLVFIGGPSAPQARADTRLLALDRRGGRPRALAIGAFDDMALSPSGRSLALTGPAEPPRLGDLASVDVSDPRPRRRLRVLDLSAGDRPVAAPDLDLAPTLLSWAPNGERLLFVARATLASGWSSARAFVLDVANRRMERLGPERLAWVARLGLEAFPVVRGGWRGAEPVLQPAGQAGWLRLVDSSAAPEPRGPDSGAQDAALALAGGVRGRFAVYASPDPARVTQTRDSAGVTRIARTDPDGELMRLNGFLAEVQGVTPQPLARTTPMGRRILDWLYLPALAPARAPALVVVPYPGPIYEAAPPSQAIGASAPVISAQLLAASGYAVLIPSLPRAPEEPAGPELARGVSDALDAALATGRVDPSRIALWGHSFGGYLALMTAARDPRFRAVIAEAAPTDLVSLHGAFGALARLDPDMVQLRDFGTGWSEGGAGALAGPPSERANGYLRASPVLAADRITAPVMLIYGDQDFVPESQGEEMFAALRRRDKEVRLLVFAGEGHLLATPANQRRRWREALAFLRAHLGEPDAPLRPGSAP